MSILIILVILGIIGLKCYLKFKDNKKVVDYTDTVDLVEDKKNKEEETVVKRVFVDIKGAVVKPGVYEIDSDKKVIDVVNLAGGFKESADSSFVNLAKKVSDEMVVIIYTKEEIKKAREKENISVSSNDTCVCPKINNDACLDNNLSKKTDTNKKSATSNSSSGNTTVSEKVNINTANLEQLQTLSGVGASKAQAILEYREKNGNFTKIEDIMKVSGIGNSVYEKIKDSITV